MLASRDATRNRSALFGGECKRRPDPHDGLTGRPEPARDFTDRQPLSRARITRSRSCRASEVGRPTCRPLSCANCTPALPRWLRAAVSSRITARSILIACGSGRPARSTLPTSTHWTTIFCCGIASGSTAHRARCSQARQSPVPPANRPGRRVSGCPPAPAARRRRHTADTVDGDAVEHDGVAGLVERNQFLLGERLGRAVDVKKVRLKRPDACQVAGGRTASVTTPRCRP